MLIFIKLCLANATAMISDQKLCNIFYFQGTLQVMHAKILGWRHRRKENHLKMRKIKMKTRIFELSKIQKFFSEKNQL